MRTVAMMALAMLAGCGTAPVNEESAGSMSRAQLCMAYGAAVRGTTGASDVKVVRGALGQRGDFMQPEDDAAIRGSTLRIGGSSCLLYASWGRPVAINRTVTGGNSGSAQYVYERGRRRAFAYLNGDVIRAFQD